MQLIPNKLKTFRENPLQKKFPKFSIIIHTLILFAKVILIIILLSLYLSLFQLSFIYSAVFIITQLFLCIMVIKNQTVQFIYCYYYIKRFHKIYRFQLETNDLNYEKIKSEQSQNLAQYFTHKNDQAQLNHYHSIQQQKSTPQHDVDRHYGIQCQQNQEIIKFEKDNYKFDPLKTFKKKIVHYSSGDDQIQNDYQQENQINNFNFHIGGKRISLQYLSKIEPNPKKSREVSEFSEGMTYRTVGNFSKAKTLLNQNFGVSQYIFQGQNSIEAKNQYELYKKTIQKVNITPGDFKNIVQKVKDNFLKLLYINFEQQLKNLQQIRSLIQNNFCLNIQSTQKQLSQEQDQNINTKQQKFYNSTKVSYQKVESIFDIVNLCFKKAFVQNQLNQLAVIWELKYNINQQNKTQFFKRLQFLLQERKILDKYLAVKPAKLHLYCDRKYYLLKIKNILEYYGSQNDSNEKKKQESIIFSPQFPLIMINFLYLNVQNALIKQSKNLLPKIDKSAMNQTWIQFKQLDGVRFNHFSILFHKQSKKDGKTIKGQIKEKYACIPGANNLWCAIYFYFYAISKKLSEQLKEEPQLIEVMNTFLKK